MIGKHERMSSSSCSLEDLLQGQSFAVSLIRFHLGAGTCPTIQTQNAICGDLSHKFKPDWIPVTDHRDRLQSKGLNLVFNENV